MAMTEGVFAITLIHSLFQHHAPAQNHDDYNDAYIGFSGDRDGESDPPAVKIKPGLMTWKETALVADYGDNSALDTHYSTPGNKNTFFDAGAEPKAIQKVWIPKMPTPPAELAYKIAMTETTPWEMHGMIEVWEEDRSAAVKALMVPLKNWCIYATTKGGTSDTSAVAANLPLLHRPSQELRNAMLARLDGTLDERWEPETDAPQDDALRAEVDALRMQMALSANARANATTDLTGGTVSGEEMFLRGTEAVMRHREDNSDSVYKRFDRAQKAKICGFCCVKTWNQVPAIWTEIEATKDEKQLRDLMSAEWGKLKTDLNSDFATVY